MALTLKKVQPNIMVRSSNVTHRQQGQRLALELHEQTRYLVEKICRCNPNQPCNTSACDFCGNRFPKHTNGQTRDSELRVRPKSKVHQSYNEHPEIWNAAPAKLSKYAPKAAAQLFTAFHNQYWLEHVQHFTLNETLIPFDHNDLDFVFGNYKTSSICLSFEVRTAISNAKPKIREIFYSLDDAPFYGIFECTIVELDKNPLWETEERKWAEVRSRCKYGILVHVHGVFAGTTKKELKKACDRFGYGGKRQTAIGELQDEYEEEEYQKGGIGGWGEYVEKNQFNSDFGSDTAFIYAIHEHLRKQVGRHLIRLHHKSYKQYPIVRTWECVDPKDYSIFDEMHQDYLEHYVYPFLSDDDYETDPIEEPSYQEIYPNAVLTHDPHNDNYDDWEYEYLSIIDHEIEQSYQSYLEYEYGDHASDTICSTNPIELNHYQSFNSINGFRELSDSFKHVCDTFFNHYTNNYSNSCFYRLAKPKGFRARLCREAHFWIKNIQPMDHGPIFHKRE